jgi:hypothetical protein
MASGTGAGGRANIELVGGDDAHDRGGPLFGQDQLVRLRDAQAVFLAVVHDHHLAPALEERRALDAADP